MNLIIPELSLVVLVGSSGSGKTTFARKHFNPTEVLSSDVCRGMVCDDENCQEATADAFEVLNYIAAKRLAAGRLTVVDATSVQPESRKPLVALARAHNCLPVAIVFDLPAQLCEERNLARADRNFGPHVIRNQQQQLRRSLRNLRREGFRYLYILDHPEKIDAVAIERQPLWNNRKSEHGPFDIIGDVHGCHDELRDLLANLGWEVKEDAAAPYGVTAFHPEGRKLVFLGDLVDRGPQAVAVLKLAMSMTAEGSAMCVPGNHDMKLLKCLRGRAVKQTHGLAETVSQLASETPEFHDWLAHWLDALVSHYVLDDGKLVVAHAGMKEAYQGRGSGAVREFALFGETTGETDEYGLPVRTNWAADYRGRAMVVYGHTPVAEAAWENRTINIDTGCVFGGRLTALRYPERDLVSVPARKMHYQPIRPLPSMATADEADEGAAVPTAAPAADKARNRASDVLDIGDVLGKRTILTRLHRSVTIREGNASAALEVISRFAADPRWLIYLPPTMAPCETSKEPGMLEHPAKAFAYYREHGVERVVCEQKHMGSRAVVIVCRTEADAVRRFGIAGDGAGICYTRTGRRFFVDRAMEAELIGRVRAALDRTGFWETFHTQWVCLDCELMPWSVKAQDLLRQQYAAVGAAARAATSSTCAALDKAAAAGVPLDALPENFATRRELADAFTAAYRRYCWPVHSVDDLRLAPFHLLATEGAVHADKDHVWHMDTLGGLCQGDPTGVLLATPYRVLVPDDAESANDGAAWWLKLTAEGGEGMVVKPFSFIARAKGQVLQPAVKCRGSEYLRIIYGPEYDLPDNLDRLRRRGLSGKRSLALREFSLGIEGLERFVNREPLYAVHECVFGVLALESEPVDPRL